MPLIEWNDSFSVGHSALDRDHRALIQILDDLCTALSAPEEQRRRSVYGFVKRTLLVPELEALDRFDAAVPMLLALALFGAGSAEAGESETVLELQDGRVYQDVSELQRLQSFVSEGLKRFEFDLRRKLDADEGSVVLSGSDQVPEEFRKLVEQYYRSLSRGQR